MFPDTEKPSFKSSLDCILRVAVAACRQCKGSGVFQRNNAVTWLRMLHSKVKSINQLTTIWDFNGVKYFFFISGEQFNASHWLLLLY